MIRAITSFDDSGILGYTLTMRKNKIITISVLAFFGFAVLHLCCLPSASASMQQPAQPSCHQHNKTPLDKNQKCPTCKADLLASLPLSQPFEELVSALKLSLINQTAVPFSFAPYPQLCISFNSPPYLLSSADPLYIKHHILRI